MEYLALSPIPFKFALTTFVINATRLLVFKLDVTEVRALALENFFYTPILLVSIYAMMICHYERVRANAARRNHLNNTLTISSLIGSLLTIVLLIKSIAAPAEQEPEQYGNRNNVYTP